VSIEHLTKLEEQTIALAGIFQSCHQVQLLANSGQIDTIYLNIAIKAILNTDPDNTLDIFQNIANIREGLDLIQQQLGTSKQERDMELTRYSIGILFLATKLSKNPDMLNQLSQGIEKTEGQIEHFGMEHANIYAGLGGLYSDTISQSTNNGLRRANHFRQSRYCQQGSHFVIVCNPFCYIMAAIRR